VRHHDELSVRRLRSLATLQLLVNVLLVILYEVAIHTWNWHFNLTTGEKVAAWSVWILSLVCLAFSSSLYPTAVGLMRSLSPERAVTTAPPAGGGAERPTEQGSLGLSKVLDPELGGSP
jgi:hypothetical protein